MLTVICCYNDDEVFGEVLEASLAEQEPHQLLVHRNSEEVNTPIPVVYNQLREEAQGDWLLFVHQDVKLLSACLLRLEEKLEGLDERWGPVGVAGLAGATPDGWLQNGTCDATTYRGYHTNVQTLDECLLACRPQVLESVGGLSEDEVLSWHCYGVDLSRKLLEQGYWNYVVQVMAGHEGPHQVTETKLELLRDAQMHVAHKWGDVVGTSGGRLTPVPGGNMPLALARGLAEGRERGVARIVWPEPEVEAPRPHIAW